MRFYRIIVSYPKFKFTYDHIFNCHQVCLAQSAMLASMTLLLCIVFGPTGLQQLELVVVAYLLSGIAVGSFEFNLV